MAAVENADDVMLRWVYHGRDIRKKARSIGLLINEMPLGISLSELTDIQSLYDEVKSQMNMDMKHRYYPYTMIRSELAVNDMLWIVDEGDLLTLKGIDGAPCEELVPHITNPVQGGLLAIMILNDGNDVIMRLLYTSTRYHKEKMERFCSVYRNIAAKLVEAGMTEDLSNIT